MKDYISYNSPRTSSTEEFWRKEQELIYNEVYMQLEKKVCPQKALEVAKLEAKEYTKRATWITGILGFHALFEVQCNYNIKLVQQFFATLVIGDGPNIPMTWMTGNQRWESDFVRFSQLMG